MLLAAALNRPMKNLKHSFACLIAFLLSLPASEAMGQRPEFRFAVGWGGVWHGEVGAGGVSGVGEIVAAQLKPGTRFVLRVSGAGGSTEYSPLGCRKVEVCTGRLDSFKLYGGGVAAHVRVSEHERASLYVPVSVDLAHIAITTVEYGFESEESRVETNAWSPGIGIGFGVDFDAGPLRLFLETRYSRLWGAATRNLGSVVVGLRI